DRCMYPVPSRCAFAFAGELSARHSQCWRFRGLLVHHCYDLLSCSPPLQETFTSGLSTVRSPSPLPDITSVATGQFPPPGLTPAGPTTSVAAPLSSPHWMTSADHGGIGSRYHTGTLGVAGQRRPGKVA